MDTSSGFSNSGIGGNTPPARVAVIAVHGVADQQAGDTAAAIAALLATSAPDGARYGQGACESYMLPVPPLAPLAGDGAAPGASGARKAARQSVRSDFHRDGWVADGTVRADPSPGVATADGATVSAGKLAHDPSLAFSDYLLFKAARSKPATEVYATTRVRMPRLAADAATGPRQVDVHEMYWADLSRLSSALPRIVAEAFTLVFRLSRLGRDTIDHALDAARKAKGPGSPLVRSMNALANYQIVLDLALSALLANLFLQLLLMGVVIGGLGVLAPREGTAATVVAWTLPAAAAWWFCYRYARGPGQVLAAVVAAALAGVALQAAPPHWVLGSTVAGVLALLCDQGLRVAEERFPLTRVPGLLFLGACGTALLWLVATAPAVDGAPGLHRWITAAITVVEYLLGLLAAWWLAAPFLLALWLVRGHRVVRQAARLEDARGIRTSVATGRLGVFISFSAFLLASMALWALLTTPLALASAGVQYQPVLWKERPLFPPPPLAGEQFVHAPAFLQRLYEQSTQTFALTAAVMVVFVAFLLLMMLPSVMAEVRARLGTSQDLGRWLAGGYRALDGCILLLVVASVVLTFVFGALLVASFEFALPRHFIEGIGWSSAALLKPLVIGAASAAAALSVFGALLSRYAPWIRLPLDVALDVDNHFREFPRRAIPRARIFARYVALLEHLAAQDYDRIVIVAHSQGSVISAELLRYIRHRAQAAPDPRNDRVARLSRQLQSRVFLLTAGCPLRQLYAARFPHLYAWVRGRAPASALSGPSAADVGVQRWINVYSTGDYVGRWLWSDPDPPDETVGGQPKLHDPWEGAFADLTGREHDVCLGAGAHTHYFGIGEKQVAGCIDALVSGRHVPEPVPG